MTEEQSERIAKTTDAERIDQLERELADLRRQIGERETLRHNIEVDRMRNGNGTMLGSIFGGIWG